MKRFTIVQVVNRSGSSNILGIKVHLEDLDSCTFRIDTVYPGFIRISDVVQYVVRRYVQSVNGICVLTHH